MLRFARLRGFSALVFAALSTFGCASWKSIDHEHIAAAIQEKPHLVRLKTDGSVYHLQHAQISGDTLLGVRESEPTSAVALPLSSVSSFAVRRYHPTAFVIITATMVAAAIAIASSSSHNSVK
jgi:hypothetical protein